MELHQVSDQAVDAVEMLAPFGCDVRTGGGDDDEIEGGDDEDELPAVPPGVIAGVLAKLANPETIAVFAIAAPS